MPNGDSIVPGGAATLLEPGTEGGLRTGGYQSEPNPAFAGGNSLAGSITKPTKFFAVEFGTSTNPVDPQTQRGVVAPTVVNKAGVLTADLSAWGASWNNQEFNQACTEAAGESGTGGGGRCAGPAGVGLGRAEMAEHAQRDGRQRATGDRHLRPGQPCLHFEWTSLIVGGPFNGFTGVWHLEGAFDRAEPGRAARATATPGTGG